MSDDTIEGRDIADLLPFYANGTLRGREKARVAVALAADPALQRELTLILEERQVVTEANESLGAPSREARDRFFAMLDTQAAAPKAARFDLAGRIAALLEPLRPRTLAWASCAALAVVVLQAGVIGLIMTRVTGPGFHTASVSTPAPSGTLVVVGFVADAKLADIAAVLKDLDATIVAGPLPGGLYQIRVGGSSATAADGGAVVTRLKSSPLVRFAAPGSSPQGAD